MGANIGTSVTNTIVALGQATKKNEFRRAFAGATVHDMFNWLCVFCLLPIEWITSKFAKGADCGVLCQITHEITKELELDPNENVEQDMLKVITKPLTSLIIMVSLGPLRSTKYGSMCLGYYFLNTFHMNDG